MGKKPKVPSSLKKHAEIICLLAKAKPKVIRNIISSADKDLIKTVSACSYNVLKGNLEVTPSQKKRLHRYKESLRTISLKKTPLKTSRALLMKGSGLVTALLGTIAPLLLKAVVPAVVKPVLSAVKRKKQKKK